MRQIPVVSGHGLGAGSPRRAARRGARRATARTRRCLEWRGQA
jgi:hypothetical protein